MFAVGDHGAGGEAAFGGLGLVDEGGATEAAELEVGGAVVEIALKRHTESFMHSIFLFIIISAKAELWV